MDHLRVTLVASSFQTFICTQIYSVPVRDSVERQRDGLIFPAAAFPGSQ